MTYKELLEFTQKHPNPFWNNERHDKVVQYRYWAWMEQQSKEQDMINAEAPQMKT